MPSCHLSCTISAGAEKVSSDEGSSPGAISRGFGSMTKLEDGVGRRCQKTEPKDGTIRRNQKTETGGGGAKMVVETQKMENKKGE